MKKTFASSRPGLEILEDRCVPAVAAANLVGNDLIITTDEVADTYTLNLTADNTVEVSDGGGLEGSFSGVTGKITFTGLSGADNVALNLNGFNLDADVVFNLGGDNDRLTINGSGGQINGAVNIDMDGDNDHVGINQVTINDDVAIVGGGGFNCINIGDGTPVVINGALDIQGGDDGNRIHLQAELTGDLTIATGSGEDHVNIDQSAIVGGVGINTGDGSNRVSLTDSTIHGDVKIALGADNDHLAIDPVTIFGNLDIITGGGDNCVAIDHLNLTGNLLHQGAGHDHINLTDSVLSGSSSFNMTGDGAAMDLTIADTTLATFLSVVSGNESDAVRLNNVVVGQNFSAVMGGGCDELTICGSQIQGNVHHTGAGHQTIGIHDSQIRGYVTLNTTDVPDAEEGSRSKVRIGGTTIGLWLSITSGSGDDCIQVSDASIGDNLALDLAGGCDNVRLCGVAIHNDFWHQATGHQNIAMENTQIDGFASFNFLASDEATMNVALDRVSAGRFLSIRGGGNGDHIALDEVSAAENLAIDTGAGEDCVSIEDGLVTGSTTIDTPIP